MVEAADGASQVSEKAVMHMLPSTIVVTVTASAGPLEESAEDVLEHIDFGAKAFEM